MHWGSYTRSTILQSLKIKNLVHHLCKPHSGENMKSLNINKIHSSLPPKWASLYTHTKMSKNAYIKIKIWCICPQICVCLILKYGAGQLRSTKELKDLKTNLLQWAIYMYVKQMCLIAKTPMRQHIKHICAYEFEPLIKISIVIFS